MKSGSERTQQNTGQRAEADQMRPAALRQTRTSSPHPGPLDASPRIVAQRQRLDGAFGPAIQRQPEEEEEMPFQGNFAPVQRQGRVQTTMQATGVALNDDPALEREAGAMGRRAEQTVSSPPPKGHAIEGRAGLTSNFSPSIASEATVQLKFIHDHKAMSDEEINAIKNFGDISRKVVKVLENTGIPISTAEFKEKDLRALRHFIQLVHISSEEYEVKKLPKSGVWDEETLEEWIGHIVTHLSAHHPIAKGFEEGDLLYGLRGERFFHMAAVKKKHPKLEHLTADMLEGNESKRDSLKAIMKHYSLSESDWTNSVCVGGILYTVGGSKKTTGSSISKEAKKGKIYFILDNIDINAVVDRSSVENFKSVTSHELRSIFERREDTDIKSNVEFYKNSEKVDPPWTGQEALWDKAIRADG